MLIFIKTIILLILKISKNEEILELNFSFNIFLYIDNDKTSKFLANLIVLKFDGLNSKFETRKRHNIFELKWYSNFWIKFKKFTFLTCSGTVGCCCTDGGCRTFETNCQSNTWYVEPSTSNTVACSPASCNNSCTIDPIASPVIYVKELF